MERGGQASSQWTDAISAINQNFKADGSQKMGGTRQSDLLFIILNLPVSLFSTLLFYSLVLKKE